ncbi:MAG: PKD domain-containing protein [Phycisphaerae bacterium]|jgi:PKD repeat protein
MKRLPVAAMLALCLVGGCPWLPGGPVRARITISSTTGVVPLEVQVSAAESTSTTAGELTYAWDFGDGSTADTVEATHTYDTAGTYTIVLHVTDAEGNIGPASVEVRVEPVPVAIIKADTNAGLLPLAVQFDGSASYRDDDVISEYHWDFGDASETSEQPAPAHTYEQAGVYTATLRVVTATGLEATTTSRITAGAIIGSLQVPSEQLTHFWARAYSLPTYMFEVWFKADPTGGLLFSFSDEALTVTLHPNTNLVEVHLDPNTSSVTVHGLDGQWRHIALIYDTTMLPPLATVYLDGEYLTEVPGGSEYSAPPTYPASWWDDTPTTVLHIGASFSGRIAEVRWWVEPASLDLRWSRLGPEVTSLIGYWRLDDVDSQSLHNERGYAGGCYWPENAGEHCYPAWSNDGPPIN